MEHKLYPTKIEIDYSTLYALHKMTIPARAFNPSGGAHGYGTFEAWDTTTVEADDMIETLLTAMVALMPTSSEFFGFTIFTYATPDDPPLPRAHKDLTGFDGTEGTPGWFEAVQFCWTFYDTAFNTAKLNLLDAASKNNFARRTAPTQSVAEAAVSAVMVDSGWAFQSRAGFQLASVRSLSLGINDALKKQYPLI